MRRRQEAQDAVDAFAQVLARRREALRALVWRSQPPSGPELAQVNLEGTVLSALQAPVPTHAVFLDQLSCRGYLVKRGHRLKTWRRRWFVFSLATGRLTYYKTHAERLQKVGFYHGLCELHRHLWRIFAFPV